jgi:type II secretory pathway component GspD/PulD (secretin)
LIICFIYLVPTPIFPQQIKEIEFKNQLITDILLALAEMTGKSIIPDETVGGKASYFFSEMDFETALKVFLQTYKLHYRKEGDIYYVSKIRTDFNPDTKLVTLDAEDVDVTYLIRSVARSIGKTILYDSIPSQTVTVHTKRVSPEKLLEIIMKRFPNYTLESDKDYFYIKRIVERPPKPGERRPVAEKINILRKNDVYSISIDKASFNEIIDSFFTKAEYEYSMLMRRDQLINNVRFKNKSFDVLLRLLCEQANADYKKVGSIYYIFEISQNDVLKKFKSTVMIPLKYSAVEEVIKLFPPELASSKLFKIDTITNSIILSGSLEEIGPIQDFVAEIDQPIGNQQFYRFDLDYINVKDLKSIIPVTFKYDLLITIPNTNSFVIRISPEKKEHLDQYLKLIDKSEDVAFVKLKYIKSENLKENLPPSISQSDIIETGDPSIVFVKGSSQKLDKFYKELAVLDQPVPQVRYDLLVIQFQEGETIDWNQNLTDNVFMVSKATDQEQDAFLGSIGKLISLNFDVVSNFGAQFALQLNYDLTEDRAKILADTSLNGLSGEEIKFQNTTTVRFREFETDPNTGNLRQTGVVREIVSGLIINVMGWVSGQGMITMDVEATVSRLGSGASTDTTREPTTFEKVLKTNIRTPSGKPIAIGGLITEEDGTTIQKIPVLADIPLFGYLFQTRKEILDRSEFVIYIVPHVEYLEKEEMSLNNRMERLYNKFF